MAHFVLTLILLGFVLWSTHLAEATTEAEEAPADDDATFYFPTDEGLAEFRQILLRGLGMDRVPDLSKVNITREEYDEYRRFDPPKDEDDPAGTRHTVILNHSQVKSTKRHGHVEWKLRFRHPPMDEDEELHWEPESSLPLQLHFTTRPTHPAIHWKLQLVSNGGNSSKSALVIHPEDFERETNNDGELSVRLNPSSLSSYLDRLQQADSSSAVYSLRFRCVGKDCPLLDQWRLSGQIRLVSINPHRTRRHAAGKRPHHPARPTKSGPQPKDILVGSDKKSSGGGSRAECGKKGQQQGGKGGGGKRCCPHSLKINFRQLPGFDWILEPSEIDIFMCKGDCHYSQVSHNPASNHALFQGYLHTVNKRLVPKLCCTPSKLESVQIVHYDQEDPGKLTTTKWDGAIVKECACA